MVSTRSHPTAFPPPELASPTKASPSKRGGGGSRATSTASPAPAGGIGNAIAPTSAPISTAFNDTTTTTTNNKEPARTTTATDGNGSGSGGSPWTHTPSRLTLAWLALSLPLVAWDTGYMLLRPHSMPGGRLHAPLWTPYALYGAVDHVYGFPAWRRGDGFGAAQATLNLVETALYLGYVWVVYSSGNSGGGKNVRPAGREDVVVGEAVGKAARVVAGRTAARAVLVAFAASVMTLSKTVLYWLVEYWSGFQNIGHNDAASLFFLWIVPNGAWLVLPTYMMYVFGSEIVQGLEAAGSAGASTKKSQ